MIVIRFLVAVVLIALCAIPLSAQPADSARAALARELLAEANALAPVMTARRGSPDGALAERAVRASTDTDVFEIIDSIASPGYRLAALLGIAAGGMRPDLIEAALERARTEAATHPLTDAPSELAPWLEHLQRMHRTADVVAIGSAIRPLGVRASVLIDALGMEIEPRHRPLVSAIRAAADSMGDGAERLAVEMQLAWLDGDSANAVAATRALLAALRGSALPLPSGTEVFATVARRLGFRDGSASPAALLRELEVGAPPQVTLDVAHAVTQRWRHGGSDAMRRSHDELMRAVLASGWRAAGALPPGLAERSRADLILDVARTSPAVALERVDELAVSDDRELVRLTVAETLLLTDPVQAAAIGNTIRSPELRARWLAAVVGSLVQRAELEAALDSADAIPDDTMRAAARGYVGSMMHRHAPSESAYALVHEALGIVRLMQDGPPPFPPWPDIRHQFARAARMVVPTDEMVAWARSHEDLRLRADALRIVAEVLQVEAQPDGGWFGYGMGGRPYVLSHEQQALILGELRATWRTLPDAARDSLRSAVVAAHLAFDDPALDELLADGGIGDHEMMDVLHMSPENALRAVLATATEDSIRDAAYAGIARDRSRTYAADPLAAVDSIIDPENRLTALVDVAQMSVVPDTRARADSALKHTVATSRSIDLNALRRQVHGASILTSLAASVDVRSRAILLGAALGSAAGLPPAARTGATDPVRVLALADSVEPPLEHAVRAVALSIEGAPDRVEAELGQLSATAASADSVEREILADLGMSALASLSVRGHREAAVRAVQRMTDWLPRPRLVWTWSAAFTPEPLARDPDASDIESLSSATVTLPATVRDSVRFLALNYAAYRTPRLVLDHLDVIADVHLRDQLRTMVIASDPHGEVAALARSGYETKAARDQVLAARAVELAAEGDLQAARALADSLPAGIPRGLAIAEIALARLNAGDADAVGDLLRRALDEVGSVPDSALTIDQSMARQGVIMQAFAAGTADTIIDWASAIPEPRERAAALAWLGNLAGFAARF